MSHFIQWILKVLRLTYEFVFNFISCGQLVGLGGLHRQADDLIGLLYLGQHYFGNGWQVLQAGVEKGVGRVAREGRSDLWEKSKWMRLLWFFMGEINILVTFFDWCQQNTCFANRLIGGSDMIMIHMINRNNTVDSKGQQTLWGISFMFCCKVLLVNAASELKGIRPCLRDQRFFGLRNVALGPGLPTCVILSCGMVSKLGEENVNPLSVPASYGKSSSDTFSFQWSPSHRSTLSTPTNQSGLGTIRTMNDSWRWRGGSRA